MKTLKFKPYFFEPLRSRKKMSTIRKSDKGLKKGDLVFSVSVIISCCLVLCLTDFFDD